MTPKRISGIVGIFLFVCLALAGTVHRVSASRGPVSLPTTQPQPPVAVPPLLQTVTVLSQPAATDFAISALPATSEEMPSIDGAKVVWYDDRTHSPTDVWGYDLVSGQQFQVTSQLDAQLIADISGDVVVYEDNRNGTWDIFGKHLSTGSEFVVATGPNHQRFPRIWGDYVVYQDETSDYWQSNVYLYRISTGVTTPLAVAHSYQGAPDIDNGWIVWMDWRSGNWQLAIYRISTGASSFRPIDCDDGCRPRVHNHEVVWNGWRTGSYDIYLYDLLAGIEYTVYAGAGDQRLPCLGDTLMAWQDESTFGNWNVFVYVRSTGTLFPVTLEPSRQQLPAVYANTVVWQDNRSHTWDIYGLTWDGTVPPGVTPPVLNPRDLHVGAYPNREIHLSWTDHVPNEQGFVIQRATGIFGAQWTDWVTLPANTTAYVDTSGTLRESYWYRVRATNTSGDSSYSNESYSTAFDAVPSLDERTMHVLINEARMAPGAWGFPGLTPVDPVGWDANLAYSARAHALGMNNSNCCQGHGDLAGRGPSERAYDSGYPYGTGENLFQATSGREGMELAHQGFMNSEGHRNNIMAADLRQTAIGFAPGGRGTLVEVFSGGPAGVEVPALPSGVAVPYTGTVNTTFDYLVSFWNEQQQAPSSAVVVIDGAPHAMNLRSGQPGRGTYIFSTTLAMQSHSYYFMFRWGNPVQTARLPQMGEFSGPFIRPFMPDLKISGASGGGMIVGLAGQILAVVENSGESSATDAVVRFYDGDPDNGGTVIGTSQVIEQIDPGQSLPAVITWVPPSAGAYRIYMAADPDDVVQEGDESNNLNWLYLTVRDHVSWFVDGSVAASGDGLTPETAFKTIREGTNHAMRGDTVHVAAGIYSEGTISVGSDTTLRGSGLESTVIDLQSPSGSVLYLRSGSTLEGLTVKKGIGVTCWNSCTIRHNRLEENGTSISGMCSGASNCLVSVERNIIKSNRRFGIVGTQQTVFSITNNTLVGTSTAIVTRQAGSVLAANILAHTDIGVQADGPPPTSHHNIFWVTSQIGMGLGEGDLLLDPMLRDWANGDFRVHSGSPAVGQGSPAGTDIGAVPFVPVGSAPMGVTVNQVSPGEWAVRWTSTHASGYNVYLGTQPGQYSQRQDAQSATTWTLRNLSPGAYYVVVTSYDAAGDESRPSSEIGFNVEAIEWRSFLPVIRSR